MSLQPINSVMRLILPAQVDLSIDPKFRGYVEQLTNAIQQLQNYIEQYCGITQKLQSQWSTLTPVDTLLEHQLNRLYVKATETIAYGAMVNLAADTAGVLSVRNANATDNTKPAHGWCSTVGGVTAGSYCECILNGGLCTAVNGLTIGTRYFLSTTAGIVANGWPTAAGTIRQYIGTAIGAQLLLVNIEGQFVQN